jgi:hypothetical protein
MKYAERYFKSLLQFDGRSLLINNINGAVIHPQPFTGMPNSNRPAWLLLDYLLQSSGMVVSQDIYIAAPSARDVLLLNMPIFLVHKSGKLGLWLNKAMAGDYNGQLNGHDAPAPVGDCHTISIRINVSVSRFAHLEAVVRIMSLLVAWLRRMESSD